MNSLLGLELPPYVNFIIAFVVVLLLIGLVAWAVKRFGGGRFDAAGRARQPRLAVVDHASVDSRRKLVIIRRDNVEHLLMIGGPTDVVVETNIVRGGAAATREAPALRASAADTTLPRAMPLPDSTPWPLQPEPASAPAHAARIERPRPVEPAAHWPQPAEAAHPAPAPAFAAQPPGRQPRQADTLAGLAAELGRPTPEAVPPQRPPRPALVAGSDVPPQNDQNLADMAHRLEAALKRPLPQGQGQPAQAARPAPEPKRAEAKAAPRPEPKAAPATRGGAQPKPVYESLEQEMASLLSRPGKT